MPTLPLSYVCLGCLSAPSSSLLLASRMAPIATMLSATSWPAIRMDQALHGSRSETRAIKQCGSYAIAFKSFTVERKFDATARQLRLCSIGMLIVTIAVGVNCKISVIQQSSALQLPILSMLDTVYVRVETAASSTTNQYIHVANFCLQSVETYAMTV